MRYPQHWPTLTEAQFEQGSSSTFLTQCHRNALDQLSHSFADRRSLAILIGTGRSASRFVTRKFISRLGPDVAVARIAEPCTTAAELMGEVISAVGFIPRDMDLDDAESIFSMFLSFQKGHDRRTVICIEEAQEWQAPVLDKICRLVEMEREGDFGMTVILSGQSGLEEMLYTAPLSGIDAYAENRISLAPFTLPETREYIRRQAEAADAPRVERIFHRHAVSLVHELCAGVPDAVDALVSQCLELAEQDDATVVEEDAVKRAYEILRAATEKDEANHAETTASVTSIRPPRGRLVVRIIGEDVRELDLRHGNVLIGRSKLCDIRIDSRIVSRHHALISYSPEGATIVDLGSTNGTSIDGAETREHELVAGETITIGDCQIEYTLADPLHAQFQNAELPGDMELNA